MAKVVILMAVVLSIYQATEAARDCYMEMLPPGGIVIYPLLKSQQQGFVPPLWWGRTKPEKCMLYMDRDINKHVKLVFRSVKLGRNTLTVETANARNSEAWSVARTIRGSHAQIILEISDIVGLKLSVKKKAGRFFLFYQEFDCKVPDPHIVEKLNCTNYFHKNSFCEFQCRGPKYLAKEPGKSFSAKCRDDGTWSWNVTYACGKLDQILQICYGNGRSCNHSAAALAEMIPEDKRIPLQRKKFHVLQSAAQIQFLRKHAPKNGEEERDPPRFHPCNAQCLKSRATDAYLFECKSPDLRPRHKEHCLRCRYTGTRCDGYVLYL